jgi:hypothetical protein
MLVFSSFRSKDACGFTSDMITIQATGSRAGTHFIPTQNRPVLTPDAAQPKSGWPMMPCPARGLLGVHDNLGVDVVRDFLDEREGHLLDSLGLERGEGAEDLGRAGPGLADSRGVTSQEGTDLGELRMEFRRMTSWATMQRRLRWAP